jgi:hypothetical protein
MPRWKGEAGLQLQPLLLLLLLLPRLLLLLLQQQLGCSDEGTGIFMHPHNCLQVAGKLQATSRHL